MVREAPRTAAWGQPGGSEHTDLPWKVDACLQATSQATVVRLVVSGQYSGLSQDPVELHPVGEQPTSPPVGQFSIPHSRPTHSTAGPPEPTAAGPELPGRILSTAL